MFSLNATLSPAAPFGLSGPRRSKLGKLRPLRRERELPRAILRLRPVPVTVPLDHRVRFFSMWMHVQRRPGEAGVDHVEGLQIRASRVGS